MVPNSKSNNSEAVNRENVFVQTAAMDNVCKEAKVSGRTDGRGSVIQNMFYGMGREMSFVDTAVKCIDLQCAHCGLSLDISS